MGVKVAGCIAPALKLLVEDAPETVDQGNPARIRFDDWRHDFDRVC